MLVAVPGDTHLDLDIKGVYIRDVLSIDNEILVDIVDGRGSVAYLNGSLSSVSKLPSTILSFSFPEDSSTSIIEKHKDITTQTISLWKNLALPIRITAAPGKFTRFAVEDGTWVVLPRYS